METIGLTDALLDSIPSPLDNAIIAINSFIEDFDFSKDKIGLYGFSEKVDVEIPPADNKEVLITALDSMKPTNNTAFYDAVSVAVKSMDQLEGINIVIALTDGNDNASTTKPFEIIKQAQKHETPVFCVGLGNVTTDSLKLISDSTDGFFIYTKKASALDSVYNLLSKKIQAYYLLRYESPNWLSEDTERGFLLNFKIDDIYVTGNELDYDLPTEVTDYLKERKRVKIIQYYGIGGALILASIIGLGVIYIRRKKKKELSINKIYSNRGNGVFSIDVLLPENIDSATVNTTNTQGVKVAEFTVQDGKNTIDISKYTNGLYIITLAAPGYKQDYKKYLKQ